MEDRYSILESIKKRLLSINTFSSVSDEIKVLDDAMNLILDAETTPDFNQNYLIDLQVRLNQCECIKERATSQLQKHENDRTYFKLLNNRKIGIVGGHPTSVKNLKNGIESLSKEAKIKFQETYDGSVPDHKDFKGKYKGVDLIVALTGYAGHALTGHVDMLEREIGIPVIRAESAPKNLTVLIADILSLLRGS